MGVVSSSTFYSTKLTYIHCYKILTAAISYHNAKFGEGNGPVFLYNLECVGSENRLLDCEQSTVGHNLCDHSNDVGVRCYGVYIRRFFPVETHIYIHTCMYVHTMNDVHRTCRGRNQCTKT